MIHLKMACNKLRARKTFHWLLFQAQKYLREAKQSYKSKNPGVSEATTVAVHVRIKDHEVHMAGTVSILIRRVVLILNILHIYRSTRNCVILLVLVVFFLTFFYGNHERSGADFLLHLEVYFTHSP